MAAATSARLAFARSTSAPIGVCVMMPASPPTVSAIPTLCSFQPFPAR